MISAHLRTGVVMVAIASMMQGNDSHLTENTSVIHAHISQPVRIVDATSSIPCAACNAICLDLSNLRTHSKPFFSPCSYFTIFDEKPDSLIRVHP